MINNLKPLVFLNNKQKDIHTPYLYRYDKTTPQITQKMATKKNFNHLSTDQIINTLHGRNAITVVVATIFIAIIMLWLVLADWRNNLLPFIGTIVMAVGVVVALYLSGNSLRKELKKRK